MTTVQAIETEYAGCRFRSRLEARWAVFFDRLGIEWEYEPEGFEFSDGTRYLPDFHFINMPRVYVEVKGADEALASAAGKMLRFARESERSLLVLGPVPPVPHPEFPHATPVHPIIDYYTQQPMFAAFAGNDLDRHSIIQFTATVDLTTLTHDPLTGLRPSPVIEDAYRAARSARFEFGERG